MRDRLEKVIERLRCVRIENKDAIKLIKMFINRPATLIYLDPPYLGNRTMGYSNDLNDEDYHLKMLEVANKANCMIFISGYDNKLYRKYLTKKNGWTRKEIITNTNATNGDRHTRNEVVWMNKIYTTAVKTGRIPIILSEKEKKEKKLNPERL